MRKAKISVIILIIVSFTFYSRYYTGLYIDFKPSKEVSVQMKTEGKDIYLYNQNEGIYEIFQVKGVEVGSSIPGFSVSSYEIDKKTWIKWFHQIQTMGANTIKISNIFDDTFYNAFYEFNSLSKSKLYLIQGIHISDYANNSGEDAYNKGFFHRLKKDSIKVVDVVHGKRNINTNKLNGSGKYRRDISPWVLGYVIGSEWDSGTMAYTNNNKIHSNKYNGKYFRATDNATVFEAMLAEIMDGMVLYESKKYKTQRLVSFINNQQNDPFTYENYYAKQLNKYNLLDAENIKTTNELKSGYIATYRVNNFCTEFSKYFSMEQKLELSLELENLNQKFIYDGYTKLLAMYHTMPVVIFGDGFSTSRGTDEIEGPITEIEQGERLVSMYRDIVDSGCNGSIISMWQDTWEGNSWNTAYSVDIEENFLWHDIQTKAQGSGLLSFEPGNQKTISHVDGDLSEWNAKDLVFDNEGTRLSLKYDEKFIYLLVEKEKLSEEDSLYIGIDTTKKSGSKEIQSPKLSFDREVDFIIKISGKANSRILVHERYESLRQNYLMQIEGDDPFINFPEKDSTKFVPIRMICKYNTIIPPDLELNEIKRLKLFKTFETGKLVHGNSNPDSISYNSLADFYYGNNFVELRLPWQILNFSNPQKMKIHDDYYENYGVEQISISNLYIGVSEHNQEHPSSMAPVKLNGWGDKIIYHERLKKSYFMLKEEWGK